VQSELGSSATTDFDIANTLSKYFSSTGEKLANRIEKTILAPPTTSQSSNLQTSFFLFPTCPEEMQKVISNLAAEKAVPIVDILIKYLKLAGTTISKFLADLFNTSILDSEYPDDLKIAQIIPIHRSGSIECCSNYRPISILPAINKVFEKLLYSRLYSYIETNELLSPSQYGFREGTSTELAINEIYNYYLHNLDQGLVTGSIFLDLSKAFDTVNHKQLLEKLEKQYGNRGLPLKVFENCLANRTHFVSIENIQSQKASVTCGVPQGSNLGALFLLLDVNDITHVSKIKTTLFADDTVQFFLFQQNRSLILQKKVNEELNNIDNWLNIINYL